MGLKDRIVAAKRYMWSPMTLSMLERGSDPVAKAGETARVVVEVEGESDGTVERIEVRLKLNEHMSWPVAEVPPTVGRHELDVTVPADAPPTSRFTRYYWVGKMERTKGMAVDALSPVRVISHPDHVFWPDGPRTGSDDPAVSVTLDTDTVNAGGRVAGRVTGAERIEVGVVLDAWEQAEGSGNGEQKQRFKAIADVRPGPDGAFTVDIPAGAHPTLYDGDRTWITWEVRAGSAWARFAVLDPDGQSEVPELQSSSLLDLIT